MAISFLYDNTRLFNRQVIGSMSCTALGIIVGNTERYPKIHTYYLQYFSNPP